MEIKKTLRDIYSFPGFRARDRLKPHPKDRDGRIVTLERRQKNSLLRVWTTGIRFPGPAYAHGSRPGCRGNPHIP